MNNGQIDQIKDLIAKNQTFAIAVKRNPSIDEMGAALALYLSLQNANKNVSIASPSEPIVEVSSLVGIDNVKTQFAESGKDLTVLFPYKEGEIEKVSYTLENGYLNIIVKAGDQGLSFSEKDVQYKRAGGAFAEVLFVIGTSRLANLDSLYDADALKDTTVVNIDNKADNSGFGDVVLVSPQMSSVSEQVAQVIHLADLPYGIDIAQNLMAGIMAATNGFQSPKTSYLAFEMTGILMKHGAVRKQPQQLMGTATQFMDQSFGMDTRQNVQRNRMPQQQRQQFPPRPIQSQPRQPAQQPETPPQDWLTPKVYRGSTNI